MTHPGIAAGLLTGVGGSALRLDPRTKLVLMVVLNVLLLAGSSNPDALWALPALATIPAVLLLTVGAWVASLTYATLTAAALAVEASPLVFTGVAGIAVGSLIGIVLRIGPSLALGYYIMRGTTVAEFIAAMERARVPRVIVIPLSVVFRFLPTVAEESRSISDAMRMRGLTARAVVSNPVALLEYRFVPLLASLVRSGDEVSAAALTRGLGGPNRRTTIALIGMRPLDWLVLAIVAIITGFHLLS